MKGFSQNSETKPAKPAKHPANHTNTMKTPEPPASCQCDLCNGFPESDAPPLPPQADGNQLAREREAAARLADTPSDRQGTKESFVSGAKLTALTNPLSLHKREFHAGTQPLSLNNQ